MVMVGQDIMGEELKMTSKGELLDLDWMMERAETKPGHVRLALLLVMAVGAFWLHHWWAG